MSPNQAPTANTEVAVVFGRIAENLPIPSAETSALALAAATKAMWYYNILKADIWAASQAGADGITDDTLQALRKKAMDASRGESGNEDTVNEYIDAVVDRVRRITGRATNNLPPRCHPAVCTRSIIQEPSAYDEIKKTLASITTGRMFEGVNLLKGLDGTSGGRNADVSR